MDWSTLTPKIIEALVAIALVAIVPALLILIRSKIGLVKDEALRAFLLEVVAAVEKMIPRAPDRGNPLENAAKLDAARKIVMEQTGKTVPDYRIAAAVTALKGVVK